MIRDMTWNVIEKTMEGQSTRFKSTSRNLSNANTPGYARRNVSFESELRDVINSGDRLRLTVTNEGHIPTRPHNVADVTPEETRIMDERYRLDGNNVDPEREMAVLAQSRMMYSAMSRLASKKVAGYRSAIAGR